MDRGWYARLGLFVVVSVIAVLVLWPSVSTWVPAPAWVESTFGARKIAPGLDIRGGLRLTLEVEVDQAVRDRRDSIKERLLTDIGEALKTITEGESPTPEQLTSTRQKVSITARGDREIALRFTSAGDASKLTRDMVRRYPELSEKSRNGADVVLEIQQDKLAALQDTAVDQAVKTISDRVDEFGVREAIVAKRGMDIIVEVPGADEASFQQIRSIISRTARLEFKMVDDDASLVSSLTDVPTGIELTGNTLIAKGEGSRERLTEYVKQLEAAGKIPEDHQLAIGEMRDDKKVKDAWRTYYLFAQTELTGDYIDDAQVAFNEGGGAGGGLNAPYVALRMNSQGADIFERLTGRNVGKNMAILLDDRVESAPNIKSKIPGGNVSITLGGYNNAQNLKDAQDLVIVLKAGALPVPIRPSNEQMIGPSLGRDAVKMGGLGAAIGIGLVLLAMALYYQVAGLIADVMVLFNILFLFATLALFQATLTLPGIAGVVLTVGMSVDANVLITERIREELRLGKSPRGAVDQGFSRAFLSIFDGHVTTLIAGIVLFQYGTGPIKGFAVTLIVGIVASLFSGVFCSRIATEWLVSGLKVKRLAVG